jgi:signal peptidase II
VKRSFILLVVVAGAVLALDQWSKALATAHLPHRSPVPLVGSLVQLTYTRNSGVAFGLGAGTNFPFWLFSIAAALVIVWLFLTRRVHGARTQCALALILGGALGNLVDRVTAGTVVDFILLSWRGWDFPVFNLADTAVTVGVALFALGWSLHQPAPPGHEALYRAPGDGPPGGVAARAESESAGPGAR